MEEQFIPVYLFVGFLESGKTSFIQKTFNDSRFAAGDKILLVVCEEGEKEYSFTGKQKDSIIIKTIDDVSDLTAENLAKMTKECRADCAVVEYNGMWSVNSLFMNMPDDWRIFQSIFVADAGSFMMFDNAYRNLVAEKVNAADIVIFNRYQGNVSQEELHAAVRKYNRRVNIYYENDDGETVVDEIEDPLPYDMNADIITVEDDDYAIWYADIMDNPGKFKGKKVRYKAVITRESNFPKKVYAIGRRIMTCCEADMQFCWIGAKYDKKVDCGKEHWVTITATVSVQHDPNYGMDYPVLDITSLEDAQPPQNDMLSFS